MAKDPVCGMTVDPRALAKSLKLDGQIYYFCSETYKSRFSDNPSDYLKKKGTFARFIDWLVKGNQRKFAGHPPSCCGR